MERVRRGDNSDGVGKVILVLCESFNRCRVSLSSLGVLQATRGFRVLRAIRRERQPTNEPSSGLLLPLLAAAPSTKLKGGQNWAKSPW